MKKRKKFEPPDLPIVEPTLELKPVHRSWKDMSAQERVDVAQANSQRRFNECSPFFKTAKRQTHAISEYKRM